MASATLVVFGSGPGIGISVAKLFAQKHFDRIALCARSAERLASEKAEVEDAAKKVGRTVQVHTYPTDLSNLDSLSRTLKEIDKLGPLGCVYHNAARINPSEPLAAPVEEIEEDFKTGNLALYVIAKWAVPLLQKGGHSSPSFLVTNSHLPEQPMSILLSLSMSKASQQNMIIGLHEAFGKDIHFGVIKVCGQVSPEKAQLNPTNIAEKAVALYEQKKGSWELTTVIVE